MVLAPTGAGIIHSYDKDVARGVHRQAATKKVAADRGKGALAAVPSNFHNACLKRAGACVRSQRILV